MTLLFSEEFDMSTNHVIDWFIYSNKKVLRYNGNEVSYGENGFEFNFIDKEINFYLGNNSIENKKDNLNEVKSVWFRRPYSGIKDIKSKLNNNTSFIPKQYLERAIDYNKKILKDFLVEKISNTRRLGSYKITGLNKPIVLKMAAEIGLKIPKTIITNSKESLVNFFHTNDRLIITKALHEAFRYVPKNEGFWISNKTVLINSINNIPDVFAPSILQEYIHKKYEIRSFYLDGKFYSGAIFSQKNEKTKIDFRNYDDDYPNRIVPFELPDKIKEKLYFLMTTLKLNSGSIDLIKSKKGDYIFLEINPVGQYGFLSAACNFNIDYEIYKYLTYER